MKKHVLNYKLREKKETTKQYADALSQKLGPTDAIRVLTEGGNAAKRVIEQGEFLNTDPRTMKKLLGFYSTAAGYLNNKLGEKSAKK